MKGNKRNQKEWAAARRETRVAQLSELHMTYKGESHSISLRPPDISSGGMFVNTSTHYQEGAVVILRFRLTRSNVEVQTRAEVRYCLAGIGIGVEFIGIESEAARAIEEEVRTSSRPRLPRGPKRR